MPVSISGFDSTGDKALRTWYGSATTDANGAWSIDYSSAEFSAVPQISASVPLNTGTIADKEFGVAVTTASTTGATGTILRGATLVALGTTLRAAAQGHTIYFTATGPGPTS